MSNLFVAPKGAPPPWYRDPGLPTFDSVRNNKILKKGMEGMQPGEVWDQLVLPKGLKPLPSLLLGDLGPMVRREFKGKSAEETSILPGKPVALNARKRDSVAATMTAEMLDELLKEEPAINVLFGDELFNVAELGTMMNSVCAWRDVAPAFSLGRLVKYLSPKMKMGLNPPSVSEVSRAALELGLPFKLPPPKVVTSRGIPECDVWKEAVTWNGKATAGLPHLCRGDKDPEVFVDAAALAEHFYVEFRDVYRKDNVNGIKQKYRELVLKYPGLFTNIGKTKSENVTLAKAESAEGRFYNATPLWTRLLLSTVTQVFEEHSAPFGTEYESSDVYQGPVGPHGSRTAFTRNTQGLSFFNGGAARYVKQFSQRLNDAARRHRITPQFAIDEIVDTNCGDDSDLAAYVCKLSSFVRMMFDMSSFDLTQHWLVLRPIVDWLCGVLSTSDPVLGQLWREMYTYRPTWIMGCMQVLMECGGPSGLQLQSKVNALLMRVFLNRFKGHLRMGRGGDYSERTLSVLADTTAAQLGLVVKLEQYAVFDAERYPIYELTLAARPVLYLGYFLWLDLDFDKMESLEQGKLLLKVFGGRAELPIWPCFDLRRLLPSLPFPNSQYEPDDTKFAEDRWIRVASLYYTCGVPPECLAGAVSVLRRFLLQEGKRLRDAGVKFDVNRRASFWETNLASAGSLPEATFEDLPRHVGSLFAKLSTPLEDIWDLEPPVKADVPKRERVGPFPYTPQRLPKERLPKERPSVTRTGLNRDNFGRPPPVTPWAPPRTRRDGEDAELSARALRKEHPRAAQEYHESRFQTMDDDEYGGNLPRRARRGF